MERSVRRKLASELARLYRSDSSVQTLLDAAGIRNQELISWSERPINTWNAILTHVEIQEQLQDLLDVVVDQFPQDVIFHLARYQTLLQPRPQPKLPQLASVPPLDPGTAEKIMGDESTLLPILFLKHGIERARSVARTVKGSKCASGFLTENDIFVTNNHVIASADEADQTTLEFGYDAPPEVGEPRRFTTVQLLPQRGFHTDPENDITFVRVEAGADSTWGSIPIKDIDLSAVRYVNIIQHPDGASKMIGLYHNLLAYHDNRVIDYYTDTLPGSSGSPVFDSSWQLVGIHREGGLLQDPTGRGNVFRNRGTSISALVAALTKMT